jgi:hypothetical protein
MILLLLSGGSVIQDPENRAVRNRAQRPLPIIVIANGTRWAELHGPEQCAQRDVDIKARAGTQANFFPHCGQEGRCADFQRVDAGKKVIGDVVSGRVGEDGEGTICATQYLDDGAHLGSARCIANVSGNFARPLSSPCGERQAKHDCPSSEPTQVQIRPTPWGNAGSYSTANIAEGSTV